MAVPYGDVLKGLVSGRLGHHAWALVSSAQEGILAPANDMTVAAANSADVALANGDL